MKEQEITSYVWNSKYRNKNPDGSSNEDTKQESYERVIRGVYAKDDPEHAHRALRELINETWVPAGRIHAGAGTNKRVTWINCFVSPIIEDSMETEGCTGASAGIMDALKIAALTQQMGGGIGMDFSTLRPRGAIVGRTGSVSSGPLHFMDMWHAMCSTVMSSGSRRGAMMGTMRIDHPDVVEFIEAKNKHGRLTNFNVSVLVTDAFMKALEVDGDWDLGFNVPRADGTSQLVVSGDGTTKWHVYETVKARDLWDKITKSTYEFAEPGVIFIDRVNQRNNLSYCETISCTNPCGEQPLPPNGDCNLGAVNLAKMVLSPFTSDAVVDWETLKETTRVGVRFLDNVLDTSPFPTDAQREEALSKRRIGLGITGLGNMLQQMMVRYGTLEATRVAEDVMQCIKGTAYRASVDLAKERGSFPAFDAEAFLRSGFVRELHTGIRDGIERHGIRNGVLLTIAPTGTTSLYIGNVSSGCEPSFAWTYERKVRKADGEGFDTFQVEDYGYRLYCEKVLQGKKPNGEGLPPYMVTALELTVHDHLAMQAALQRHVDSSISKTINCPESMTLEEFKEVYLRAYELGLKGCTTYRPSDIRGAVLTVKKEVKGTSALKARPQSLQGATYKVRWEPAGHAFYVTINDSVESDGKRVPFEIFINSKSVQHQDWIAALTRTISAVFRRGGDLSFLPEELEQVHSATGGQWENGKYVPSLVALIGGVIRRHFEDVGIVVPVAAQTGAAEACTKCGQPSFIRESGCGRCLSCGYSSCD